MEEDGFTTMTDVQEDVPKSLMVIDTPHDVLSERKARRISLQRARPFTKMLWMNEGLRQNLVDEQAQRLIRRRW